MQLKATEMFILDKESYVFFFPYATQNVWLFLCLYWQSTGALSFLLILYSSLFLRQTNGLYKWIQDFIDTQNRTRILSIIVSQDDP